ncbi:MAG: DUF4214 domain-containing protein [Stenotrophobium sp.]
MVSIFKKNIAAPEEQIRHQVQAAYRCILGREAEPEGLEHWMKFLHEGGRYDKLILSFVRSSEFECRLDASRQAEKLAHVNETMIEPPPLPSAVPVTTAHVAVDAPIPTADAYLRGRLYGEQYSCWPDHLDSQSDWHKSQANQNPLEAFFDAHKEGPGLWKWRHYFEIYQHHFEKFVGQEVHILEIGVYSGGGLAMWQHYFGDKCRLYGVDILEACKSFENESTKIFIGDQADRKFWKRIRSEVPRIDIVIDDGSHFPEHQIVSMQELLPHIAPGGVYLCEDIYRHHNDFHDFVSGMTNQLNELGKAKPGSNDFHEGMVPNSFQRDIHSVHLYPQVAVIEKSTVPVSQFQAPRHGTQWLKFGD